MFKFSSDRISINVDSDYGNSCSRHHKMPPPLFHNPLKHTHTHTELKLYALVRWNRKWEKNSRQKSTMGVAFWGNKSFSARIYRADNGPQGRATTKVGGQTQPPIHTRLLTGKTDFTYVPQICFAPNSSRKLLVTAATDFFLLKTCSLKMTQSRNLEGDMVETVSRVWLNKTCFSLCYDTDSRRPSQLKVTIATHLITEHSFIWSACAGMRMLSTY